jgi:hypothetical protein
MVSLDRPKTSVSIAHDALKDQSLETVRVLRRQGEIL